MNYKVFVALVIAALLLVGCAGPDPANADSAAPAINQQENAQPVGAAADPASGGSDTVVAITELTADEAATIVLTHAQLTAEDAQQLNVTREVEDGAPEFDIDFRSGDYEYDYTVSAITGEILEHDKEYDPPKTPDPVETTPVETGPVESKPVETEPVETTPPQTEPVVAELTADEALALALKHAGLSADEVEQVKTERDVDNGVPEFDIDFRSGDYEYDYTIHAITGAVMEWDKEYDPPKTPVPVETTPVETTPPQTEAVVAELTADEAIAAALEHTGLTADQVEWVKSERDVDDGVPEFDIDFRSGDYEYDYTIHAITGAVIEWDKEYDPPKTSSSTSSAPAETVPPSTELTADEAVGIALDHAGFTADQVTRLQHELDEDDGSLEWEIEFRKGSMEYSYTIDAKTGKILDWEKEKDD